MGKAFQMDNGKGFQSSWALETLFYSFNSLCTGRPDAATHAPLTATGFKMGLELSTVNAQQWTTNE